MGWQYGDGAWVESGAGCVWCDFVVDDKWRRNFPSLCCSNSLRDRSRATMAYSILSRYLFVPEGRVYISYDVQQPGVSSNYWTAVKGSVEEDENFVPVPIQFGYFRFPSCSGTTYHNCSGVPKKCPLWPRFLRYPRQKKRFMASVNTRGQKSYLLTSPQYASILKPRQNNKNNQDQKPLLH